MEIDEEETKSGFLFKNLARGLLWFAVIITIFILVEGYIQDNFMPYVARIHANPIIFYLVFTVSEIVFGLVPPEFFMIIYVFNHVLVSEYVINLVLLTIISYGAGLLGYYIGRNFSKTPFFVRIKEKYLSAYQNQLRKYGGYIIFVGAVTPVPFSAVCMLAGSVDFPFKSFMLISISRLLRFAVYGWMVWSFPNFFNG